MPSTRPRPATGPPRPGSSIIREYALSRPEIGGALSVGSRYESVRPAKSRNRAQASGKNRPTPRYSQSSSSRLVNVTLSMSIPLTRSGYRSAYASDSVTPHDTPRSSHCSTPRWSRSCSMSRSRCSVVLRLMSAAGSLACGRLRPQLRWSKMMIRNLPGSNDLRFPASTPTQGRRARSALAGLRGSRRSPSTRGSRHRCRACRSRRARCLDTLGTHRSY